MHFNISTKIINTIVTSPAFIILLTLAILGFIIIKLLIYDRVFMQQFYKWGDWMGQTDLILRNLKFKIKEDGRGMYYFEVFKRLHHTKDIESKLVIRKHMNRAELRRLSMWGNSLSILFLWFFKTKTICDFFMPYLTLRNTHFLN